MEISRFPCKRLLRMPGSTTTRGQRVSCDIDTSRVAFCGTENISTPNLSYAAQYLACALPCERFTSALADNPCITRGQCGSLLLHRDGLPPSTSCRSPGAPVHHIKLRRGGKSAPLPLFSSKQTFANAIGTSVECQEETCGAQLFDALVQAHDLMTPVLRSTKATACDG